MSIKYEKDSRPTRLFMLSNAPTRRWISNTGYKPVRKIYTKRGSDTPYLKRIFTFSIKNRFLSPEAPLFLYGGRKHLESLPENSLMSFNNQ
jgi:hypothetical protein